MNVSMTPNPYFPVTIGGTVSCFGGKTDDRKKDIEIIR